MKKFLISWTDDSFRVDFNGCLTMNEIDAANIALLNDDRLNLTKYSIWDFSNADMSTISADELESVIAMDVEAEEKIKDHRLAFIAPDKHQEYICKCYIDAMGTIKLTWDFGLFSNENEVLDWLSS